MGRSASEMLMQTASDVVRIFGHGKRADCRMLPNGCIALSGEPAADLNMVFLTSAASRIELDEALEAVRQKSVDSLLVIEEGAEEVRAWANDAGLCEVGQMPLMERAAAEVQPSSDFVIRIAEPAELAIGNRLAAAAFSLSEQACQNALPDEAMAEDGNDLWIADYGGNPVGSGIFIRSGDHVGIYTMSTPPEHQRRGIGRAILDAAMASYQAQGVARFTLGATEKGYPLYERVGFRVVTRPHIYVAGASTQFPGN